MSNRIITTAMPPPDKPKQRRPLLLAPCGTGWAIYEREVLAYQPRRADAPPAEEPVAVFSYLGQALAYLEQEFAPEGAALGQPDARPSAAL